MTSHTTEEENIDTREWLSKPLDQEYPHRVNKPDMMRNGGTYRAALSLTPIDLLHERGVIDDDQHRAAVFVMTLRRVIRNSLGFERIAQEYFRDPAAAENTRAIAPSRILDAALKGLKPHERNLVDRITALPRGEYERHDRPLTDNDVAWLSLCAASVKDALSILKKNIDDFYEIVKSGSREGATSAP